MANVFISYASEDRPIAMLLSDMLKADGQKVFVDQALVAGADYSQQIEKALADAKAVVVLLSRNSNRSKWVEAELRSALQKGHVVIPVLLDEDAMNNWVWPLISDRQAIRIDSPAQIAEVVREINRAVGGTDRFHSAARSRWLVLLVAVLSAIAGALFTWFAS